MGCSLGFCGAADADLTSPVATKHATDHLTEKEKACHINRSNCRAGSDVSTTGRVLVNVAKGFIFGRR